MLISGREARNVLAGAGFSSWHARNALGTGLVGQPVRTTAVHLYEEARVRELAARPVIGWPEVFEVCPAGIFVARRELDLSLPRSELLEQTAVGWDELNPWEWWAMNFHIERHGRLRFVATVAGVVVLGADIVGTRAGSELRLAEPGPWFERLRAGRFPTGPGRSWILQLN